MTRVEAGAFGASLLLALPLGVGGQVPDSTRVEGLSDSTATADSVAAPLPREVVLHIDHLTTSFTDTPDGRGLVPVGMDEARVAVEFAELAGQDSTDLPNMTRNMRHVLHALDPDQATSPQGLGYGVKRAAEGTLLHMELATSVTGVSETVLFHAGYVSAAATRTLERADQSIALAHRIQSTGSPEAALPLIEDLLELLRAMAWGSDADDDGRIGYVESEMGFAQAQYHLALVRRAERLGS